MKFAAIDGLIGHPSIQLSGLVADPSPGRLQPGMLLTATDNWWGTGEFIYARANGTIRMLALCTCTPVFDSTLTAWRFDMTEAPNTANLGKMVAVSQNALTSGQWAWFMVTGLTPILSNATVAADTTFGIAAAGQAGANTAGKQILNARVVAPATTTVIKANGQAQSGSLQLNVQNTDGWFEGLNLSGTGIAANTKIASIAADDRTVTLSLATTAIVNGNVTGTYNDATLFYNVAHLNRPFAQGAIT